MHCFIIKIKKRCFLLCNEKMFLSLHPHSAMSGVGAIAQLVEQRTENPCVPGSIPGGTTAKKSKTT